MATEGAGEIAADQVAAEEAALRRRLRDGDTFSFLFLLLLVYFVVAVTANETLYGRIANGLLSGAVPLVAYLTAKAPRKWIILAAAAFAGTVIISVFGEWIDEAWAIAVVTGLHMIVLFWSIPIVFRRLMQHDTVTFETVAGSICLYLLIGLTFANLYLAMSAGGASPVIIATAQQDLPIDRGDFYYFSFISMLTVGFGDFVPLTDWAKAFTALQAIIGQVVLLTLVARMVSIAQPSERWRKRADKRTEKRVEKRTEKRTAHGRHTGEQRSEAE